MIKGAVQLPDSGSGEAHGHYAEVMEVGGDVVACLYAGLPR